MSIKFILTLLLASLIFIFSPASPVSAASPSATISLTPDRHYANLNFSNLQSVTKVTYIFTYDNNGRQTGVEGSFKNTAKSIRVLKKQILGTCSTRRCVFHKNPKNFHLDMTFYLKSGSKVTLSKSL